MRKLLLILLLIGSLSSCLISLHPLYSEDTIVMEPKLAGHWESEEEEEQSLLSTSVQSLDFRMKKDIEDVTFKKNGEGVVVDAEIQQEPTGHYELVHRASEDEIYQYDAVLLKLGKYHYLNVYPDKPLEKPEEEPSLALKIPTNNFYKLVFNGENGFSLFPFDGNRMENLIKERKIRIQHEQVNDNFIITASTDDLQKFILKYAEDEKNFDDPIVFNKK